MAFVEDDISPNLRAFEPKLFCLEGLICCNNDLDTPSSDTGFDVGTLIDITMQANDLEFGCPLFSLVTPCLQDTERTNNEVWAYQIF